MTQHLRRIPPWLSVCVIILAVAGGSYLAYRLVWRQPLEADSVAVETPRWARPRTPPPPKAEYPEGVRRSRSGQDVIARAGNAYIRATSTSSGRFNITLNYIVGIREQWLTPDQQKLTDLGLRVAGTPALAEHVGATEEQVRQLNALEGRIHLTGTQGDQVSTLVQQWLSAPAGIPKDAAAKALLAVVASIGPAREAEARTLLQQRATQIAQILSKDQLKLGNHFVSGTP